MPPVVTGPRWWARQARRRLLGRVVPPCVRPTSPADHRKAPFTPYPVTTRYGATGNPAWSLGRHTGEDHAAPVGSAACATSWGTVVCVARWSRRDAPMVTLPGSTVREWGSDYGTHVVIRTRDGRFDYALCHLSRALVEPGDEVHPGMTVGLTGRSGGSGSFGPHLHLEARPAGGRFGSDIHPINIKRMERP